ncbi:MAG: thiamine diphosphokinase [Clostridia bacterium]|nr:thiamine diphosphokinase [Clostridia bacterium]
MKVAIILKAPSITAIVSENDVIYADAAYKFKEQIGEKNVLGVVGDFDSLGNVPDGEKIIGLDVEKDFTDGERAVRFAKECGADEITIYGAYGGKIEHVLGNIVLLKIAKNIGLKASIKEKGYLTELACGKTELTVKKGSALSILPYGNECTVTESKGLYYPLDSLTLTNADTRGISNVATDSNVSINVVKGYALVVYEY